MLYLSNEYMFMVLLFCSFYEEDPSETVDKKLNKNSKKLKICILV